MTAPALPGAAPDPARLPPEVERAKDKVVDAAMRWERDPRRGLATHLSMADLVTAVDELHTAMRAATAGSGAASPAAGASARALGGDGEPVAWLVVCRDGVTPGIAYLSREAAEEHIGVGETIRPLFTRPAATGDTGEGERFGGYERERARFDAWWAENATEGSTRAAAWDAYYARAQLAATGDHPSEARRGHESEGRGGPDAR